MYDQDERTAGALFDYFGFTEFLTRDIPPDLMERLTELLEIGGNGPSRNIRVGQHLSLLAGPQYTLPSGRRVKIVMKRDEKGKTTSPRRFRLTDCTPAPPKYKVTTIEDTETTLAYDVVLVDSEDGWAVFCPALRGCVSQGETEAEALENIREAMTGWLKGEARDVELSVLNLVDEYNEAGHPAKRAQVSVARIKADASVH